MHPFLPMIAAVTASAAAPTGGAASIAEHRARCAGRDGWSDPAPPVHIFANVYDIGTCGITVLLVRADAGAIVLDGATEQAAPAIVANIERLGLRRSDVKLLLSSHEHQDHAGGLAALQRMTGATMVTTAAARRALESGILASDDPQRESDRPTFAGVRVGRLVRDGGVVRLGSLKLTAHTTPGHAPGGTTWTWRSCMGRTCRAIVFADSVSAVSANGYRFRDHPRYVAAFRETLRRIAVLPCDVLITPHPGASSLYERLAGSRPLINAAACVDYARTSAAGLEKALGR